MIEGKVSHWLYFAQDMDRLVVCVELPYELRFEAKVEAKEDYLRKLGGYDELSDKQWVLFKMMRKISLAASKAIGCNGDYGAVVFLDSKMVEQQQNDFLNIKQRSSCSLDSQTD